MEEVAAASRRLQDFDGIDVQQRTKHEPIVLRIVNDSPVGSHDQALRVPHLVGLTVRHPDHERFERLAVKKLPDRIGIHGMDPWEWMAPASAFEACKEVFGIDCWHRRP